VGAGASGNWAGEGGSRGEMGKTLDG